MSFFKEIMIDKRMILRLIRLMLKTTFFTNCREQYCKVVFTFLHLIVAHGEQLHLGLMLHQNSLTMDVKNFGH